LSPIFKVFGSTTYDYTQRYPNYDNFQSNKKNYYNLNLFGENVAALKFLKRISKSIEFSLVREIILEQDVKISYTNYSRIQFMPKLSINQKKRGERDKMKQDINP
jgi:hypothetical protein